MAYLNKKKIVHRDLKPENFLISKSGELQICDFGTIRKIKNDETVTFNSSYTIRYAPPEFIKEMNVALEQGNLERLRLCVTHKL